MSEVFHRSETPDPFAKVPALAQRLGVEPMTSDSVSFCVRMKDGTRYDIFDLVNALLDRLETDLASIARDAT